MNEQHTTLILKVCTWVKKYPDLQQIIMLRDGPAIGHVILPVPRGHYRGIWIQMMPPFASDRKLSMVRVPIFADYCHVYREQSFTAWDTLMRYLDGLPLDD